MFLALLSPKSCKDIKDSDPSSVSGIYKIEIEGEKIEVRCEIVGDQAWTVSLFLLFINNKRFCLKVNKYVLVML